MVAMNGSTCPAISDIVIIGAAKIWFDCLYENPPSVTEYRWYLDGVLQSEYNDRTSAYIWVESGVHTVECRTRIFETDDCMCEGSHIIACTAVGT